MDWFLYDEDIHHERVEKGQSSKNYRLFSMDFKNSPLLDI